MKANTRKLFARGSVPCAIFLLAIGSSVSLARAIQSSGAIYGAWPANRNTKLSQS